MAGDYGNNNDKKENGGIVNFGSLSISNAYEFDPGTDKSCRTGVTIERATFHKFKIRSESKAWWEFWTLALWNQVTGAYSKKYGIDISAPKPLMFFPGKKVGQNQESNSIETTLSMEFATGDNVTKLGQYPKRGDYGSYPDWHPASYYKDLFSIVAVYLGALSKIKENELMVHDDYRPRHVIFDHKKDRLFVYDFDNASVGDPQGVLKDDLKMMSEFKRLIWPGYDMRIIDDAYGRGRDHIPSAQKIMDKELRVGYHIERMREKQDVCFDFMLQKVTRRDGSPWGDRFSMVRKRR